jgi:predicted KAP-like P-loop ATPase
MNPGELHSYLSADRPINTDSEDRFGRTRFAKALARAIRGWTGQDSLVMALYGPWGVGKTSVKNLILEALSPDLKPRVLEFNPWEWSGREQIQQAFFHELTGLLGRVDLTAVGRKRVAQLKRYAAMLEGVSLNDNFTRMGELLAIFVGFVTLKEGLALFNGLPQWLQMGLTVLIVIFGVAIVVFTFFRWLLLAIVGFFEAKVGSEPSLGEQRSQLRASLQQLNAPVLIVIDDIDRLTSIEIGQVFQLVKANADFPNLVYMMLFDRTVVDASLKNITEGDPSEYLEKIVQASFNVPPPSRNELDEYTLERIKSICSYGNVARRYNAGDVMNGYYGGVRPYIKDLRDAKRFLGSLAVHVAVFHNDGAFEVDPRDLSLLETLRVFEADLYDGITQAKELLVPRVDRYGADQRKTAVATLMVKARTQPDTAKEIMGMLFPNQGSFFGKNNHDSVSFGGSWFKESRVCHQNVFDRYFQLGIPSGDVSQAEIEFVLGLTGNQKQLVQAFEGFKQRGLFAALMDRLDYYKTDIDPEHAVPFLAALFDSGEKLDDATDWHGSERSIARVAYFYFRERVPPASRVTVFTDAFQLSPDSLYTPMRLLLWCLKDDQYDHPEVLADTESEHLRSLIIKRIEVASTSGKLLEHQQRHWIFYRWATWTSNGDVRQWMETQLTGRDSFVQLLASFYSQSTSTAMGSYVSHVNNYIDLEGLQQFLSRDEILAAWTKLNVQIPTSDEVRLLEDIRNAKTRG